MSIYISDQISFGWLKGNFGPFIFPAVDMAKP